MLGFLAIVWQDQAQVGRRVGGSRDAGDQGLPWGHPVCIPNHPISSTHVKPQEGGLKHRTGWEALSSHGASHSPLAAGQGAWESSQVPTAPWDRGAGECSTIAVGAGLAPTEMSADARA